MTDYERLKQLRNAEYFGAMIGMEHTEVSEGCAKAQIPMRPQFFNLQGTVHGGLLLTLADVTGGTAACTNGHIVATVDNSYHFLRTGTAKDVTMLKACANVIKAGRRLVVVDVKVTDQDEKLFGEGIFTYMVMEQKLEDVEIPAS